MITNPDSCVPRPPDVMPSALFAPAGSFILGFSGTETGPGTSTINEGVQDGVFRFQDPVPFPIKTSCADKAEVLACYETYQSMLDVSPLLSHSRATSEPRHPARPEQRYPSPPQAHTKMFCGTEKGPSATNQMTGVTEVRVMRLSLAQSSITLLIMPSVYHALLLPPQSTHQPTVASSDAFGRYLHCRRSRHRSQTLPTRAFRTAALASSARGRARTTTTSS